MSIKPTDAELEILNILWEKGGCSVRTVHDILTEQKDVFYTTTLKTMQVMTDKGLLDRDTSHRSHIYFAKVMKDEIQESLLGKVVDSVFGGSTAKLILSAIGHQKPSKEELAEIKSILDQIENQGNDELD